MIQQDERFKTLDIRQKHFIRQYSQGCRQLSVLVVDQATAIKEEIAFENAKTRVHVSVQLQAQEVARATNGQCERFLKSLTYEAMNARRSRVTESYQETFEWIFDDTISGPWESFSEWLKSDQQIYWISGKPGSGKSTLMKFILAHERTRQALDKWATNSVIISFFLWNAGNPLQRCVQGILCSLLHQLLMTDRSLITRLIEAQPNLLIKENYNDWSDTELEQTLIRGISMSTRPPCVFLDGLDEIDRDEGLFFLVNVIERLRSRTSAKFCISSRPEIPLQDAFSKYPKLRLQDLTKSDISLFVANSLHENFHWWDENVNDGDKRHKIIGEVVESADGVFLWVHLVLKSVRDGSVYIDTYEQILGRIRELPKTLEGLYKQAWERLGEDQSRYRTEAARYIRLVIEARELDYNDNFYPSFSLFNLSTCDDKLQSTFLDDKIIPPVTTLLRNAANCRRRVQSCCGGLLEFYDADNKTLHWELDSSSLENFYCQILVPLSAYVTTNTSTGDENFPRGEDLGSLWNIFYSVRVDFIHRTAADFLVESEWGRNLIDSDPAPVSDIRAKIFQSELIRTLVFVWPWAGPRNTADDALRYIDDVLDEKIPGEMRQRLQILVGDTYERLLDRAPVMEFIIKQLRLQIRNGQFDASFYKILCDFASSTIAKYIRCLRPSFYPVDAVKVDTENRVIDAGTKLWKTIDVLPSIHAVCIQILANHESVSTTDLSRNIDWPAEMPKIQVPCYANVSSDDLRDLIFAHLLSTRWILVDASRCLRCRTAEIVTCFLRRVVEDQLAELAQEWFNRRPGPYNAIPFFKEWLLRDATNTPEMEELLERTMESDVKVANHAMREEIQMSRIGYAGKNKTAIYKAVISDSSEFHNTEDDNDYSDY